MIISTFNDTKKFFKYRKQCKHYFKTGSLNICDLLNNSITIRMKICDEDYCPILKNCNNISEFIDRIQIKDN